MLSRRFILIAVTGLLTSGFSGFSQAFEFHHYVEPEVRALIASGKPVVLHIYAPWCLQCRAQASILARLSDDPQLDRVAFFKVDYDNQKDIVTALDAPRSTLIGYKGGREVARMSWGTTQEDVTKVLQAAF